MSLLMDALKRAESNKQEAARNLTGRDEASTAATGDFSLEPIAPGTTEASPGSPLPDLATHLEALDADLAASASHARPTPASTAAPPTEPKERAAIRNAFAAKEARNGKKSALIWLFGLLGLAGLAIGGYVWYQLQAIGQLASRQPSIASSSRPASPPGQPEIQRPSASSLPAIPVPQAPSIFPPETPSTASLRSPPPAPPPTRLSEPPSGPEPGGPMTIRIQRTQPEVNATLLRAHGKLQGNALDEARLDYEQALRSDPNNVDTLLGLAAIAQRQGRPGDAETFRQRAFEAAPHDPAAQAALINHSANSDPLVNESRLKTLLAAQPESAPLNFALGNLYARQKRWSEAQQAYFNAVTGDADNPDDLFNLAVSLDHLRQHKVAAQHYRLALEATRKRPAAFDQERVSQRLNALPQP